MKLQKGQALVLIATTKGGKSLSLEAAASAYADCDVLYVDGERKREAVGIPQHSNVRVKCVTPLSRLSDVLAGESFDVLVIDCLDLFEDGEYSRVSEIAQRHDCIVITAKQAPKYGGDDCPACGGCCEFRKEESRAQPTEL